MNYELAHVAREGKFKMLSPCRIDRAKTDLGIKFYCFVCKRYVLEDSQHIRDSRERK